MAGGYIDVILPAFNEAATIGPIVEAFIECGNVRRVIVSIDRDTTDNSYDIAYDAGAHMVVSTEHGKGQAIAAALPLVETSRVCLTDTDLTGFTVHHAEMLTQFYPGEILGVLDLPGKLPRPVKPTAWYALTGERCLPTDILRQIPLHGYSLEGFINLAVYEAGLPIHIVRLTGASGKLRMGPLRLIDAARSRAYVERNYPEQARKLYT